MNKYYYENDIKKIQRRLKMDKVVTIIGVPLFLIMGILFLIMGILSIIFNEQVLNRGIKNIIWGVILISFSVITVLLYFIETRLLKKRINAITQAKKNGLNTTLPKDLL